MKFHQLISGLLLAAATLVACNDKNAISNPVVATQSATYELPAEGGSFTLTFTANMPWEIVVSPANANSEVGDIKVTPSSGKASVKPIDVTVTAPANAGGKRMAIITIQGSVFESAVQFTQASGLPVTEVKGTLGKPYKASELAKKVKEGDFTSGEMLYVKGIISKLQDMSSSYGNATYWISDDGTEDPDNSFEIFRGKMFGGAAYTDDDAALMKVGASVCVYGEPKLYGTTPEFNTGNILITVDGKALPLGEGTAESPYNVAKARELVEGGNAPSDDVYVRAVIVQIDNVNLSFGNAQYWLSDDDSSIYIMEVYRGFWFGGEKFTAEDQIQVGDVVMVKGKIKDYKGTTEFDANNQIVELNGKTE